MTPNAIVCVELLKHTSNIEVVTQAIDMNNKSLDGSIIYKLNSVTIKDSHNNTLKSQLKDGCAKLIYNTSSLKTGKYNLTVKYVGSNNYQKECIVVFGVDSLDALKVNKSSKLTMVE